MVSGGAFLVEYPSAARVVGSTGANSDQSASVSSDRSEQDRGFAHLTAPNSKALIKTTTSGSSLETRDREVVPRV